MFEKDGLPYRICRLVSKGGAVVWPADPRGADAHTRLNRNFSVSVPPRSLALGRLRSEKERVCDGVCSRPDPLKPE